MKVKQAKLYVEAFAGLVDVLSPEKMSLRNRTITVGKEFELMRDSIKGKEDEEELHPALENSFERLANVYRLDDLING